MLTMFILNILTSLIGIFLVYKVVDGQDFEHESLHGRVINYAFACSGGVWGMLSVFNIVTLGMVVGVLYSFIGLLLVSASFIIYKVCDYNAECVYVKIMKVLKPLL